MSRLSIVPVAAPSGEELRRQRRKASARPEAMLQCPRCGARQTIETRIGALLIDGKVRRGTRQLGCLPCFMGGDWIVVA